MEDWRTEKHVLTGSELESSWTMLETPASIEVWESADVVGRSTPNSVAWRHRNAYSVVPLTLKHQSLESFAGLVKDPLLNRTFGGEMSSEGLVAAGNNGLKSAQPVSRFALSIIACAAQTETVAAWEREVADVRRVADPVDVAATRTAAWWNDFWKRSWIFVVGGPAATVSGGRPQAKQAEGSDAPSRISQAYILQRWITACGPRQLPHQVQRLDLHGRSEVRRRSEFQCRLAPLGRRLLVAEHAIALLSHDRPRRLGRSADIVPLLS